MKKFLVTAFVMLLSLSTITSFATDNNPLTGTSSTEQKEARYTQMKQRVEEIRKMDKSTLSKQDKKALRTELKDMNKEARASGKSGVYISVTALIIIILVLLLIL